MGDVYCNNCGHRNPLGSNFCSSCGSILETSLDEPTTITFHPVTPSDPVDEELSFDDPQFPVVIVARARKGGDERPDPSVPAVGHRPAVRS